MTRFDRTPPGWKDHNAIEPLEVEVEVATCAGFSVRVVVGDSHHPGASRDECDRFAGDAAVRVAGAIRAAIRDVGVAVVR